MGWEIIVFHFFDSKTCESAANNLKVRIRQITREQKKWLLHHFGDSLCYCVKPILWPAQASKFRVCSILKKICSVFWVLRTYLSQITDFHRLTAIFVAWNLYRPKALTIVYNMQKTLIQRVLQIKISVEAKKFGTTTVFSSEFDV